jgi:hypothetical protein
MSRAGTCFVLECTQEDELDEAEVVRLGPYETVVSRACTDVSLYAPDLDVMAYMLQDLRTLLRSNAVGKTSLSAHVPTVWSVHGLHRRTVVCDPDHVKDHDRVCIVGFFGNRRSELPFEAMDQIDVRLLDEFQSYPGILSYSSVELADDYWANLVVHAEPDDREVWRTSAAHVNAVEMSPVLYSDVRIYNGHLVDGVGSNRAIDIDSIKYWDYETEPVWRGFREFDPPLTRVRRQVEEVVSRPPTGLTEAITD